MRRFGVIVIVLLTIGAGVLVWFNIGTNDGNGGKTTPFSSHAAKDNQTTTTPASPAFNKSQFSLNNPASIWIVVNKLRPLSPKTYVPANMVIPDVPLRSNITNDEKHLRSDTAAALKQMFTAASRAGIKLNIQSGYRSYNFQVSLYNSYVAQSGSTAADMFSARPGYSEHQTGLAVDVGTVRGVCEVEQCFGSTPEGKWVAANAYKYGFIIRYPQGMDSVTGYEYEPWHLRYIGVPLATEMHRQGISTLEEFFGLPAAPNYH